VNPQTILWTAFVVAVAGALAIDLGLFQRRAHVVHSREALAWTLVWIALALAFNAGVWWLKGPRTATEFLAGYLIEKALSVDNLFVFLVIFSYFKVPREYESRILMWGILGALVMRALFVVGGAALINAFDWMMYVFGAILIFTALRLLVKREGDVELEKNPVVRFFRRFVPLTDRQDGPRFFVRVDGRLMATPLFLVILVIESTDVVFAVDSIPAVFAVTRDPFIVYTSNVFAILGLRALYFLLARVMDLFRFLKYGLVLILLFVGVKMLLAHHVKIPIGASLAVILGTLALSVVLSLLFREPHRHDGDAAPGAPPPPPPPAA
jgi:tellurite resistance protein TerC